MMRPQGPLRRLLAAALAASADDSALPDGVRLDADIPYGPHPQQRVDLYRPAGTTRPTPLIVVVHGGGWMIGDKASPGVVRAKVAHWVPRGVALASVNYRTFPAGEPLQQVDDTWQAIDAVLARTAALNLDAGAVYLLGHSSGAWLAAMLEARRTAGTEAPWRALVLMDTASYDLVAQMQAPHRPFMDRLFGRDPAHWAACSPLHQMRAVPRPMLLVCSSARDDSSAQAEALRVRVQSLGGQAELLAGDWGHAEINRGVGQDEALTAGIDRFLSGQGLLLSGGPGVTPSG